MKREIVKIKSLQDGLLLDTLIVYPDKNVKGIIQISHGMAEYKERYEPFMNFMAQNGYVSIINDHRGHGKSILNNNDLGYFYDESSNYIVEDLHQITDYIKNKYPNKKIILLGHSMGSMVVRKYIKKYDSDIDKLIVSGSPSKNQFVDIAILLAKIIKLFKGDKYRSKLIQKLAFGNYNKNIKEINSQNDWLCTDSKVVFDYDNDDNCGFIFTTNGFINLFKLMKDIYTKNKWKLNNKDLDILFIAGSDDPVIVSKEEWMNSQKFLKELGYKNITNHLYKGMRHEILNEKDKLKVFNDILEFIKK